MGFAKTNSLIVVLLHFYREVAKFIILLYLFSGKAVVFIRVTSDKAFVSGTKDYWFESNPPCKKRLVYVMVTSNNNIFLLI